MGDSTGANTKEAGPVTVEISLKAKNGDTNVIFSYDKSDDPEYLSSGGPYSVGLSGIFYYISKYNRKHEDIKRLLRLEDILQLVELVTPPHLRRKIPSLSDMAAQKLYENPRDIHATEYVEEKLKFLDDQDKVQRASGGGLNAIRLMSEQLLKDLNITADEIRSHAPDIIRVSARNTKTSDDTLDRIAKMDPRDVTEMMEECFDAKQMKTNLLLFFTECFRQDGETTSEPEIAWKAEIRIKVKEVMELYRQTKPEDEREFITNYPFDDILFTSINSQVPLLLPWSVSIFKRNPPKTVFKPSNGLIRMFTEPSEPSQIHNYPCFSAALPLSLDELLGQYTDPWWFSNEWYHHTMWCSPQLKSFTTRLIKKLEISG
ncbi:hypothetical protein PROFUN_07210 [Planoprotostelium fungivorum]|uniref:Uncharacterized protein n=1 Tax=Planoprotostelium fungivorum TaxID=1890364 RepID=A0A2P6NMH9_9EUKA|nr:hypothetical protein PROFUN_07210 [Planoprotostelium fungivorum]